MLHVSPPAKVRISDVEKVWDTATQLVSDVQSRSSTKGSTPMHSAHSTTPYVVVRPSGKSASSSRTLIHGFSYTGRVERVFHGVRACGWLPSEPVMMPHLVSCPFPLGYNSTVKIKLRNPSREVELSGRKRVKEVLRELDILPSTVLVIRGSDRAAGG